MPPTSTTDQPRRKAPSVLVSTKITPQQQLEALRRIQGQADQRVKLGRQLFKAAEARVSQHQALLTSIKAEQDEFRTTLTRDMVKSMQSYDQWVAQVEDTLGNSMQALETRLEALQRQWIDQQEHVNSTVSRCEALLNQSQDLLRTTQAKLVRQTAAVRSALAKRPAPAEVAPTAVAVPLPAAEALAKVCADPETRPAYLPNAVQIEPDIAADLRPVADVSMDAAVVSDTISIIPLADSQPAATQAQTASEPPHQTKSPPSQVDADEPTLTIASPPQDAAETESESEHVPDGPIIFDKTRLYSEVLEQLQKQQSNEAASSGAGNWSVPK